jgi:hypothetical protein
MTEIMTDLLNCWLTDRLADWMTDCMNEWINKWLTDWLYKWMAKRLNVWLAGWMIEWTIYLFIACLICWMTEQDRPYCAIEKVNLEQWTVDNTQVNGTLRADRMSEYLTATWIWTLCHWVRCVIIAPTGYLFQRCSVLWNFKFQFHR